MNVLKFEYLHKELLLDINYIQKINLEKMKLGFYGNSKISYVLLDLVL